jgi:molybdopterin-biosynthesis enzyme MoeA-like protein
MAGVPSIMQAMLDEVAPKLKIGVRMLSETVRADAREGDIGMQLGEIAEANPEVAIGSYPFFDPQHRPNTNVVVCTENLIRIDCVSESPNVNGDDRALLALPDPIRLAVQVKEPA